MKHELEYPKQKIELIQWLSTVDYDSVLEKIEAIQSEVAKDWWSLISVEEQTSIEKGISDVESGKLNDRSVARKLYEKWL